MSKKNIEVIQKFLANTTNPTVVNQLVSPNAIYVSLNYENKDLKKIMPWCGTSKGPQVFIDTFTRVGKFWKNEKFEIKEIFGSGENVAVFGKFTYRSVILGKEATSPFSILAKIKNDQIVYFQFMEDTFATARTFKSGGSWKIRADPKGKEFEI